MIPEGGRGVCQLYSDRHHTAIAEVAGAAQLFGVGCLMTILRTIIPRILTPTKALKSLKPSHLKLGLFFGGYIGIYRLVVCFLCRKNGRDSALYALPAGFLAGVAFRASPSTPIALAPVTSTLQILFSWLYQRGTIPENWPLVELLYCICQGLLFHARVMHEDVCPRYIVNLMRTVTSKKADEIQHSFIQKILRYKDFHP
ncbi:jg6999 [Pararge aegeria aegeria]|uniref:Jg6999 protein n=1 Tax=Pararge aegeria aegeria TaxID=348720 RepID=A0A8S4SDS2_9NEOP|nr:jg6999 [Pararge aegeria aegeria]